MASSVIFMGSCRGSEDERSSTIGQTARCVHRRNAGRGRARHVEVDAAQRLDEAHAALDHLGVELDDAARELVELGRAAVEALHRAQVLAGLGHARLEVVALVRERVELPAQVERRAQRKRDIGRGVKPRGGTARSPRRPRGRRPRRGR
jgi:hypothetical protein